MPARDEPIVDTESTLRTLRAMKEADPIGDYLQRLTPLARSSLLTELERLEICGAEMPGAGAILERLRGEFRKAGAPASRVPSPCPRTP